MPLIGKIKKGTEIVHHRNKVKDDNRLENLQLATDMGHRQLTRLEMFIDKLQREIVALRLENAQLKSEKHDKL